MPPTFFQDLHAGVALQGGASHGAYAWGVLDALLEHGLRPAAISGVSSGALMAVAIAQGWSRNKSEGARRELQRLWQLIGQGGKTLSQAGLDNWLGEHWLGQGLASLAWQGWDATTRLFSPAQMNPMGHNPLRATVDALLDIPCLTGANAIPVWIYATDVESGEKVVFGNQDITVDALLGSCCLPLLFPAVRIDGRMLWDGGYSGNPPLEALLAPGQPDDIVLVRSQPQRRTGLPGTAADITNRIHELAFQGILEAELATLPPRIRLHSIGAEWLARLPASSKVNTTPAFLDQLFQAGRNSVAEG